MQQEEKKNLTADLSFLDPEMQEMVRSYVAERNAGHDFGRSIGIMTTELRRGYSRVEMDITARHMNPIASVHGGAIFTLADVAAGTAAYSIGIRSTTLDANIHFLRPGLNKTMLYAEANVVKEGRNVLVVDVRVFSQDDELLATATFTDMVLDTSKINQAKKEMLPELR